MNPNHLTDRQVQEMAFADPATRVVAQHHLADCPLCQQRVRQYRLLAEGVSQLPSLPQDEALAEAVLERLALPLPKRRAIWPERIAMAACLGLILALVGVYLIVPVPFAFLAEAGFAVSVMALIGGLLVGVQWVENRLNKAQVLRQFFLPPTGATF